MAGIKQRLLKLSRGPEARHVGILTSGSVAAQVALVATAPLLSRLFSPAAFGVFALMLTISCYRFLRSISPALVALICLLIFGILVMHWISTRTEPAFLSPAIDFIAPFFPTGYRR